MTLGVKAMSYCVNCGVKLEQSEGKCPLCSVVVQNPMEPYDPRAKKPYPARTAEQNLEINKKYYAFLMAVIFLIPALILLFLDLLPNLALTWSLYPVGALLMTFVFAVVPALVKKYRLYWSIVLDSAALCAYLKLIEFLTQSGRWFSAIAFPLIILAGLMLLAMTASVRQNLLKGLLVPAVGTMLVGILAVAAELLISSNERHALTLEWSLYVLVPCFLVGLSMLILHLNQPLRSELHRRLHI